MALKPFNLLEMHLKALFFFPYDPPTPPQTQPRDYLKGVSYNCKIKLILNSFYKAFIDHVFFFIYLFFI